MNTNKPIRFSSWTVREKTGKKQTFVVNEVIVSGNVNDINDIKKNFVYLSFMYRNLYGKEKFQKKINENNLEVISIKLDEKILGYTNK